MNHLSAEQRSEWMLGIRTEAMEQHVAGCAECAAAVAKVESVLAEFGSSYRSQVRRGHVALEKTVFWTATVWLRSAAALALITLMIVAIPFLREKRAAQVDLDDDALLTAIQTDVARAVPSSLKPLAELTNPSLEAQNESAQ